MPVRDGQDAGNHLRPVTAASAFATSTVAPRRVVARLGAFHFRAGGQAVPALDVSARLHPAHLTQAFICQGRVARADAKPFWDMFQASRDFILTVAEAGRLDLARVYIVKYYLEGGL